MSLASESGGRGVRAVVRQHEFRAAVRAGELLLHYMPLVSLRTGRLQGVEALLRWNHPEHGELLPDQFLPAVVYTPVMRETTLWVLDTACEELHRRPEWSIAVNVSARDVTNEDFADHVAEALEQHQLDPGRLTLELTEHAMVTDLTLATQVLGRLREVGVGLALDDFGTGYSSLLYLRELPLTQVKIDRTFTAGVLSRPDDAAIVDSVVRLAASVGLEIVAEGVESSEQAAYLRDLGCDAAQGFLWGHPVDAAEMLTDTLSRWEPPPAAAVPVVRDAQTELSEAVARRIQSLVDEGASLHTIAAALNSEGLKTARDTRWTAKTVAHAVTALPR